MRTIISIFLMLCYISNFSVAQQNFEGVISYKITLKGKNIELVRDYMPKFYTFSFKNKNVRLKIKGGIIENTSGDILYKGNEGCTYTINKNEQIIYKYNCNNTDLDRSITTITQTNDSMIIAGYNCKKYKVLVVDGTTKSKRIVWVTKDIKIDLPKSNTAFACDLSIQGIDGIPLLTETTIDQAGLNFDMNVSVINIDERKLNSQIFKIPKEYPIKDFDVSRYRELRTKR